MPVFLKQSCEVVKEALFAQYGKVILKPLKNFSKIQSGCSIHSYFLKPLHWNIHELWHKAPKVMKVIVYSLRASNWTLDLLFLLLKFSWLLGYIFLNLFFISPDFLQNFHNIGMIYI